MEMIRMIGGAVMVLSVVGFVGSLLMPAVGFASFYKHTMPVTILSGFFFFVALALTERAAKFAASRKPQQSKIWNEPAEILKEATEVWQKAYDLAKQGRYAEAAEVNARQALEELKVSEPAYCLYCKSAVEMWIKARETGKALYEARNILYIYVKNDGKWLKYNSGEYAENLTSMVSNFFAAGYAAEAAVFAGEVNHQLESFGLPMRCAVVPVHKNIFPTSCTDCGGNLSHNPYQDTAQCGYCKAIIYPLNPLPEAKDENANRARTANIIAVNAAADAANRSVTAERRIILPPANLIEKGSPHTFYGNTISYTVPANWERRETELYERWDDFHSPDKKFFLSLSVNLIREKEGDMLREFNKIIAEKPEAKVSLKVLDGDTLGIFSFSGGDKINFKMNSVIWESFSPPDAKGETNVLKITMFFPAEEFELHKQLISDIYGSFRIRK
ncbi:MAG: hypothetical protein LH614_06875 [Pyrinomonadaceae bacterium]|nr:hypothetical protein [Pyrinomonadaceae bacterium]